MYFKIQEHKLHLDQSVNLSGVFSLGFVSSGEESPPLHHAGPRRAQLSCTQMQKRFLWAGPSYTAPGDHLPWSGSRPFAAKEVLHVAFDGGGIFAKHECFQPCQVFIKHTTHV